MAIIKIEDVPIMWAKLTEDERDMGPEDGSDTAEKITAKQGQYCVNLMLTPDKKAEFIAAGIPTKGLVGNNFRTDKDGKEFYSAKRPHWNPFFKDPDTGTQGVLVGPPNLFHEVDGEVIPWVIEEDGKLGNGTIVTAKINVYQGKIVQLMALMVTEHVAYEPADDGSW